MVIFKCIKHFFLKKIKKKNSTIFEKSVFLNYAKKETISRVFIFKKMQSNIRTIAGIRATDFGINLYMCLLYVYITI